MRTRIRLRWLMAGTCYLLGALLIITALLPTFQVPGTFAFAEGPMQLSLASITCDGLHVQAQFEVTNLPAPTSIASYGAVSYVVDGMSRTATFSARTGDIATYLDRAVLPSPVSSLTLHFTSGSVTLSTTSGSQTLALSNPGTYVVTCSGVATVAPTATPIVRVVTATPTETPVVVTATPAPTLAPTQTAVVEVATAAPTLTPVVEIITAAPTETPPVSFIGGAGTPSPSTLPETGSGSSFTWVPLLLVLGVMLLGSGVVLSRHLLRSRH